MATKLYHNPKCSKSRATLELLREKGIEPEIIKYLDTPPSLDELRAIHALLAGDVRDMVRTQEPLYKKKALDDSGLVADTLLQAINQYPKLMQRPIVIHDGKAAIGRPPENILEIL